VTVAAPPSALGAAALGLASKGMHVIPLRGKVPLYAKVEGQQAGSHAATTDPEVISKWWGENPNANIGLVMGPSKLVMIDLDGPEAAAWWMERQREHGPVETVTSFTGRADGGMHLFFRAPEGVKLVAKVGKIGPHADVRCGDTYAVVAPSIHPDTGAQYRWGTTRGFSEPPPWLIELCKEKPAAVRRPTMPLTLDGLLPYVATALGAEVQSIATAVEGTRNATLNTAALNLGQLVGGGLLPRALAEDSLRDAALAIGLGEAETRNTIRSGLDAGLKMPRRAPESAMTGKPKTPGAPTASRPLPGARPAQARWAAVPDTGPDPFGEAAQRSPADVGVKIALIEPSAELDARAIELSGQELELIEQGVSCAIRDAPLTSCLGCPVSQHDDPSAPLGALCRIGRAIDETMTHLVAAKVAERAARG
jgi:hypothetical protein